MTTVQFSIVHAQNSSCDLQAELIIRFVIVAGDNPNKQTRNETSRGVSQQVSLGTIYRSAKQEHHGKPKVMVNGDLIPNSKDQNL